MPPTLDPALLCNSRAGSDLGLESGLVEELCKLGLSFLTLDDRYRIPSAAFITGPLRYHINSCLKQDWNHHSQNATIY